MSLRSMAVLRAEAEEAQAGPSAAGGEPAPAGGGGGAAEAPTASPTAVPEPGPAQDKLRDQLITLIPAEALGAFVALVAFFASNDVGIRWAILVVVTIATPIWVAVNYAEASKKRQLPGFEMIVGTVAFLAWSATVPATPWLDIDGFDLRMGTGIVLAVSFVLALAVKARAVWAKPAT